MSLVTISKWLNRLRSVPPSASSPDFESEIPRYPPFAKGLPVADSEKILDTQSALIANIREGFALGEQFDVLVIPVIRRFAEYAHLLPASEHHHHRGAGGLFRHSLEVAFYAVRSSEAVVFNRQAYPSRLKALEPRWRMAAFLGGLFHDAGKPISDVTVVSPDGQHEWNTFTDPTIYEWATRLGIKRYHLRWTPNRHGRHERHTPHALYQLMTPEMKGYLQGAGKEVPEALMDALTGLSVTTPLSKLIIKADSNSVEKDLREQHIGHVDQHAVGVAAERYIISAIRSLVAEGEWKANVAGSVLWIGDDGAYINWRPAAKHITQRLTNDKIPGIPQAPDSLAEILLERDLAEGQRVVTGIDNVEVLPYWRVKVGGINTGDGTGHIEFLGLKMPLDVIYSSVAIPPSWDDLTLVRPDAEVSAADNLSESSKVQPGTPPEKKEKAHYETSNQANPLNTGSELSVKHDPSSITEALFNQPSTSTPSPAKRSLTQLLKKKSSEVTQASAVAPESANAATPPEGEATDTFTSVSTTQNETATSAPDTEGEPPSAYPISAPLPNESGDEHTALAEHDWNIDNNGQDDAKTSTEEIELEIEEEDDYSDIAMEDDGEAQGNEGVLADSGSPIAVGQAPALDSLMAGLGATRKSQDSAPTPDHTDDVEPFDSSQKTASDRSEATCQHETSKDTDDQATTPNQQAIEQTLDAAKQKPINRKAKPSRKKGVALNVTAPVRVGKPAPTEASPAESTSPRGMISVKSDKPPPSEMKPSECHSLEPRKRPSLATISMANKTAKKSPARADKKPALPTHSELFNAMLDGLDTSTRALGERVSIHPDNKGDVVKVHLKALADAMGYAVPETLKGLERHHLITEAPTSNPPTWLMLDGSGKKRLKKEITKTPAYQQHVEHIAKEAELYQTPVVSSKSRQSLKAATAGNRTTTPSHPSSSDDLASTLQADTPWWRDRAVTDTPGKRENDTSKGNSLALDDNQNASSQKPPIQSDDDAVDELIRQIKEGKGRWLTTRIEIDDGQRRVSDVVLENVRQENPALTRAILVAAIRRSSSKGIHRSKDCIIVALADNSTSLSTTGA